MRLFDLIKGVKEREIIGNIDVEVKDIVINSNSVTKGSLFICITGGDYDGHDFVKQAEQYGAVAIIAERKTNSYLPQIIVKDSRKTMSILAKEFYGKPDEKLKIIGVFGTNGKTTVTHMITSILSYSNKKCGLIGTLGIYYNGEIKEPTLTTPDPLLLFKTFKDMSDNGIEFVIMEVSAHAIYFEKVYGINFHLLVFTNFSRDHLDFFTDMENYKNAKLKLVREAKYKGIVTNSDDEVGREISSMYPKSLCYGLKEPSDVFAIDVKEKKDGVTFIINLFDTVYEVNLNFIGKFNVYNALASATATALLGIKTEQVVLGLENLKGVNGRVEKIYAGDYNVFVDYAHTPDGLEKVLKTLRRITKGKLLCLFGCGGNRDKTKREIMGEISAKLSDFTLITSDNPRFEEPMEIMREIEKGVLKITKNYILIEDRTEAIRYALNIMKEDDVLLIAGKGGEQYQEIYGIKRHYNDKDAVKEIMQDIRD